MFDVVVIGGGMVGACCAHECAGSGLRTLLLERQRFAAGASGRGGGLLLKGATDVFVPSIVPLLLANQELLERFLQETEADVEYLRGGSLYIAFEDDWAFTQSQVQQMCSAGLNAELWDTAQLRSALPLLTQEAVGARFIASDAQLSPYRLTLAFAEAAQRAGAKLRTDSAVRGFLRDKNGSITGVHTDVETISTQFLILATNGYSAGLWPPLETCIVPTRGQVLLTAPVTHGFPFACATNHDLQYWRQTRSGQILFGGCRRLEQAPPFGRGTDSTDTTPQVQEGLKNELFSLFPEWRGRIQFERSWAGTMGFTPDYKPLVGRMPGHENVLIGAGFSGNGLPLVCITAKLLTKIILDGSTSPLLSCFDPSRLLPQQD